MYYLVTYTMGEPNDPADISGYYKEVCLKNMSELKDFMLLMLDSWKIISIKQLPIYDTLQDFKDELQKLNQETDIEMGKLSQNLDN